MPPQALELSAIAPNSPPQQEFWDSDCREILYGGQAGGGKTWAEANLPLKWAHLPGFLALTLRRNTKQLEKIIKETLDWYPKVLPGLQPLKSPMHRWNFASGASHILHHCQNDNDYLQYEGWEINLLQFDELTHFTEQQYKYICARVRSSRVGYPTYIRASSNPGGPGHAWVLKRWGAWLDPDFITEGLEPRFATDGRRLPPAKPGEVFWILTVCDKEVYYREPQAPQPDGNMALSRTFIPASLDDNVALSNDLEYRAQLNSLDKVRRAQLLEGNWLIKPGAGLYFKRQWCDIVEIDDVPQANDGAVFCRYWDRAATEETDASPNPDYTSGVLMAKTFDPVHYWVIDEQRARLSPAKVDALIDETAAIDREDWGPAVLNAFSQDPGQAGKDQAQKNIERLSGYRVRAHRETGPKLTRFYPFSSQAEPLEGNQHGNVSIVRGPWNEAYFSSLEAFDGDKNNGEKDDPVDATSGAFGELTRMIRTISIDAKLMQTKRYESPLNLG